MAEKDPYAAYAKPVAQEPTLKERQTGATVARGEAEAPFAPRVAAAQAREAEAKASKAEADAAAAAAAVPEAQQKGAMKLTPGQQKVDENFAARYNDWISAGEYSGVMLQLKQLEDALKMLESGKELSGPIIGRLPPLVQQILYGDDPQATEEQVNDVTVSTLRAILGSQFTNEEGKRIQKLSYNPTLDEKSNIKKLVAGVRELRSRAMAMQASSKYFEEHGTLAGFKGPDAALKGDWDDTLISSAEKNFEDMYGKGASESPFETIERVKPLTERRVGASETYVSAEAKRLAADLEKAWREGASVEEILKMNPGIDREALRKAEEARQQDPPVYARFLPYSSERDITSKAIGAVADNPVLGPSLAFVAKSAPSYALDEMAGLFGGDPESVRFGLDYLGTKYPAASAFGTVTGEIGRSIAGSKALERLGMAALPAAFTSETGMGAVQGAFEAPEDQRLAGAIIGGGEGAMIGSLPFATSRILNPQTPEAIRSMREAGVDMSVGQTLGLPNLEAAVSRVAPVGGDISLAAQKGSFEDFQRAYLDEAGKFIGAKPLPKNLKPTERFATAQKAFDDAYKTAKSNLRVARDPEFDQAVADFRARLRNGVDYDPANARRLEKLLDDTLVRKVTGSPSGDTYKELDSLLGRRRASFAKQQNSELADGVKEMEDILRGTAVRNSPPEAIKALEDVDTGYSYLIRAEEAAKKTSTPPGEFTPQQLLTAVQKGDLSARNRAFSRGEARGQDFAQKGVEALGEGPIGPSALERGVGIFGAGTLLPMVPNAIMGMSNAPLARQMLNTAIAGTRPEPVRLAGELIASKPYVISAPADATLQAAQAEANRPPSIEELIAAYGYRDVPLAEGDVIVGPELTEMQRRYAEQMAQQPAAAEPVAVEAAPVETVPAEEVSDEDLGITIDKATGRPVAYNPKTKKMFFTDTGEDYEGFASGGLVHAIGEEPKAEAAPMFVPFAFAKGGPVALKNGGNAKKKGYDYANAARTFGQGLTFGFGDEIEARLRSGLDNEEYRRERDRIRALQEIYAQRNPKMAMALEGAGMVGGSLLAPSLGGARVLANAPRAARFAVGAADDLLQGAAYGAGKARERRDIVNDIRQDALGNALAYSVASGVGAGGRRLARTAPARAAIDLAARPIRYAVKKVR